MLNAARRHYRQDSGNRIRVRSVHVSVSQCLLSFHNRIHIRYRNRIRIRTHSRTPHPASRSPSRIMHLASHIPNPHPVFAQADHWPASAICHLQRRLRRPGIVSSTRRVVSVCACNYSAAASGTASTSAWRTATREQHAWLTATRKTRVADYNATASHVLLIARRKHAPLIATDAPAQMWPAAPRMGQAAPRLS